MIETLHREAVYLWHYFSIQFSQIFAYWVLGIVLGSLISVFGKQKIHQLLESLQKRKLGAFGVVPASIIGIASPLCMYGTIPIAASFSQKGVKDDWLASFMMSSVLLNPQLIIYSAALGIPALMVRIVSCFLCGIAAGLCVRFFYARKEKSFFNFSGFEESSNRDTDPNLVLRLLKNIWRNIKTTAPYFLIGVALSAAFQRYIPESWMVALFGNNKAFGLLMAAAVGVPLYACGGGTIPLLRWWLADGMSLGGAAAFMITGPATKITNLGALKIVLGFKRFLLYLLFTFAFAFLSGLLTDWILGLW
jgi:uncharacterized membrane protein YraQ (UPF0718 family)